MVAHMTVNGDWITVRLNNGKKAHVNRHRINAIAQNPQTLEWVIATNGISLAISDAAYDAICVELDIMPLDDIK